MEYKDGYVSSTQQQSDKLLSYGNASPSSTPGTTYRDPGHESELGSEHTHHTPAYSTLNNVLTQFTEAGTSLRDTTLSFDLTDKDGRKNSYSVTIPKGSTVEQAVGKINRELKNVVSASADGSSLKLKSKDEGEDVEFSNFSGNMMQYAKKSSLAGKPGAVIDGDTVYVPSTLTLSKVSRISRSPWTAPATGWRSPSAAKAMTSGWKTALTAAFPTSPLR